MSPDEKASVDTIIAELVAQRLEGKTPDIEAVAAAHPDKADELRARFADLEKLAALWQQMSVGGRATDRFVPLQIGTELGEFEVIREIGRGGMGRVYLARQKSLGRTVALKVISHLGGVSPTTRQRFLREAQALASLSHPNIVPVFGAGETEDALYIAMEFVDGLSLADLLEVVRHRPSHQTATEAWQLTLAAERGSAGTAERAEISDSGARRLDTRYVRTCCQMAASVARALHVAHEKGVVHRDVKPFNIIVDRVGTPRLLDFGLASVETQPHVTVSGEFFGTPHYVAPEQARGEHDRIDRRADVYSLGATLYECLTLATPFSGKSTPEILSQVVKGEPQRVRKLNPSLPKDLETIVGKAMESASAARYATAADFADDLDRFLDGRPVLARRAHLVTRVAKRIRRRPVHAALAVLLVLCTAVGIALFLHWHAVAKHAEYERLMDEGYVLLHRAMVGVRPTWLPEEIARRRQAATNRFTRAIEIEPRSFQAHMQRARLLAQTPEGVPRAIEDAQTAARIRPEATSPRLLARLLTQRVPPESLQQTEAGDEPSLDTARGYNGEDSFFLGELAFDAGAKQAAYRHYSECLAQNPDSYWALLHRAVTGEEGPAGEKERILRDLTAAQSVRPDLPFAHVALARWRMLDVTFTPSGIQASSADRAVGCEVAGLLEKAISLAPDEVVFYQKLASVYSSLRDWPAATAAAKTAISLDPSGYSNARLAKIHALSGDGELVSEQVVKAVTRALERPQSAHAVASALQEIGQSPEALACYRAALIADPDSAHLHARIAYLLYRMGEFPEALRHYESAISLNPDELPLGYVSLLKQEGQTEKAIQILQQVLATEEARRMPTPQLTHLVRDLAWILAAQDGSYSPGIEVFRQAVARHPNVPALRFQYGRFLLVARRPDEAIEQLNMALGQEPTGMLDKSARFQLAEAYVMKGEHAKAAEQWRAVLNTDALNVDARARLAVYLNITGRRDEAEKRCREGISLGTDDMRLRLPLAMIAEARGDSKSALKEARSAFDLALNCVHETRDQEAAGCMEFYFALLGRTRTDVEEILTMCDDALQRYRHPIGKSVVLAAKSRALLSIARRAEAEKAATDALGMLPEGCPRERLAALTCLGASLEAQERPSEALDAYVKAVQTSPRLTPAHVAAARLLNRSEYAQAGLAISRAWYTVVDRASANTQAVSYLRSKAAYKIFEAIFLTRLGRADEAKAALDGATGILSPQPIAADRDLAQFVTELQRTAEEEGAETLSTDCRELLERGSPTEPTPAPAGPRAAQQIAP